jgi:hypothetical protein
MWLPKIFGRRIYARRGEWMVIMAMTKANRQAGFLAGIIGSRFGNG